MKFFKFREGFLGSLFVLVIPIVIQNLITCAVSMADVLMLGQVDQTSLSASSLASQVQFLLNILYFGMKSAITILASQYWGKRDRNVISKILGIGLIICVVISTTVSLLAFIIPKDVMRIWTDKAVLLEYGGKYLRYVAASYFFMGISQPYLAIMKSCERVKLSMVVSSLTMALNVFLNATLIFGLFGLPKMGIAGAALATSISRGVEFLICLIDFMIQKYIPRSLKIMFRIPGALVRDFVKYSLPALGNDLIWGLAYNMNSVIMGRLGEDIVAANAIVVVARDIVTAVGFGISSASAILLGKEVGCGKTETALDDASSIVKVAIMATVVQGLVLLAASPFIPNFAKLTDVAKGYLRIMLLISTVYQFGQILNTVMIASLFRCGGDSVFGMVLDLISMWCVSVPLGMLSAFVFKFPPIIVYAIMCTDEFIKMPVAVHHYRKKSWIKNLTREIETG